MDKAHGPHLPTDPTDPQPGICGCGCGQPVARRYAPGHDAKHHSTLAQALGSGNWRQQQRAADLLSDLGWTGYAERAALRAVPYRASNGLAQQHIAEVVRWQVAPSGLHHAHRSCPALTDEARAAGALNRWTRRANDTFVSFTWNTPELAHRLAHSWDQCTDCSTTHHRDEIAEARELAQTQTFERTQPEPRKSSPTSWTVQPDGPGPEIHRWWNHTTNKVGTAGPWDRPTADTLAVPV